MADKPNETTIAQGTEFDGCITSECGIRLSGKVKGEVSAPSLTVCESGVVDGMVQVLELRSDGEVSGEIEAETIELSGRVSDKTVIRANTLEVKLNHPGKGLQVTFGDCELQVGEGTIGKTGKVFESSAAANKDDAKDDQPVAVGASSETDSDF